MRGRLKSLWEQRLAPHNTLLEQTRNKNQAKPSQGLWDGADVWFLIHFWPWVWEIFFLVWSTSQSFLLVNLLSHVLKHRMVQRNGAPPSFQPCYMLGWFINCYLQLCGLPVAFHSIRTGCLGVFLTTPWGFYWQLLYYKKEKDVTDAG